MMPRCSLMELKLSINLVCSSTYSGGGVNALASTSEST